jgi:hypothetical protein
MRNEPEISKANVLALYGPGWPLTTNIGLSATAALATRASKSCATITA